MKGTYRKKKNLWLSVILCVAMVLAMIPGTAYGASTTKVTTIDLNSTKDLSGTGYYWDAAQKTLTLTNANLKSKDGSPIIQLPDSGNVTIKLKGENKLTVIDSSTPAIVGGDQTEGGTVTIESSGTGTLYITGYVYLNSSDVTISNCILYIEPVDADLSDSSSYTNAGEGDLTITNKARVILKAGVGSAGKDLIIDGGYLQADQAGTVSVDGNITVVNGGELVVENEMNADAVAAVELVGDFTSDTTSTVKIVNAVNSYGLYVSSGDVTLLSKELLVSGQTQAIFTENYKSAATITLPDDIKYSYTTKKVLSGDQWYHVNLYLKTDRTSVVTEIDYISDEAAAAKERTIAGIEATTISLSTSYTSSGKIKLSWKKSAGYRVDYYQVYRSTKRSSGYGKKPFYTTAFGVKTYYINVSTVSGTKYYYKVRGVREIDGVKYYTQWSNKAWRTAK